MPSPAHETIVRALHEQPALLAALSERLLGARVVGRLQPVDSNLRAALALEVRPDLVYQGQDAAWIVAEVQNRIDPDKGRRWPLAAAILLNRVGAMGAVIILTTSQRVAEWARQVAVLRGPVDTELILRPAVLLITPDRARALLDPHHPELALFAVWSVHRRHGPTARRIVRRAVRIVSDLPGRLRRKWLRAIVNVLSRGTLLRMRDRMKKIKDLSNLPLSPWAREFLEELEAEGLARGGKLDGLRTSLFKVLAARKLAVSDVQRRRIVRCIDPARLEQWIAQAVVATSTREALSSPPAPDASPRRPSRRAA